MPEITLNSVTKVRSMAFLFIKQVSYYLDTIKIFIWGEKCYEEMSNFFQVWYVKPATNLFKYEF